MKTTLALLSVSFLVASCSTSSGYSSIYQTYPPTAANGYKGLIASELSAPSTSDMARQCASFGGLDYSSVQEEPTPSWKQMGYNYKSYKCKGPEPKIIPRPMVAQELPQPPKVDLNEAKSKCIEIGFVAGTEALGNCVLKLTK
jgi:hypothetical protein